MMSRVVLVVNEIGMGNGVLELPFVIALAKRFPIIVHIQNPLLELLGPRAFGATWTFFPSNWAMDAQRLRHELRKLTNDMGVTHVVNFRNEDNGNEWNRCFAALRANLESSGIVVWDLLDQDTGSCPYIQSRWSDMFCAHRVTPDWLQAHSFVKSLIRNNASPADERIVFCTGGSREDKCLPAELWAEVVTTLRCKQPELRVRLVHGRGPRERQLGAVLENLLEPISGGITVANSVEELATELSRASAVVSNDSFPMHLAYALGRPTLGLFSTTLRSVWGPPDGPKFRGLSSAACNACSLMPPQGTCWAQPACPSTPNASWSTSVIADELVDLLSQGDK
jgi:hypothetical protein